MDSNDGQVHCRKEEEMRWSHQYFNATQDTKATSRWRFGEEIRRFMINNVDFTQSTSGQLGGSHDQFAACTEFRGS